jgi:F-type H+-transporting ATPase subunit a
VNSFLYFASLHVEIAALEVFRIGDFSVTNAMLTGIVGWLIVATLLIYVGLGVKNKKYNRFIGLIQWVYEGLNDQVSSVIHDSNLARKVAPVAITIFFLVLINYWLSVMPGLESVMVNGVPLLRSPTADLNFVLALAIVSIITAQIYAVKYLGAFGNLGRYFRNPLKDPIGAFEGILELVGEFSRAASLALRLFGNAFAGEILLIVIAVLSGYLSSVTLPVFMLFELLIGFIQAYVFFMLTLIFVALAVSHGHGPEKPPSSHSQSDKYKTAHQLE